MRVEIRTHVTHIIGNARLDLIPLLVTSLADTALWVASGTCTAKATGPTSFICLSALQCLTQRSCLRTPFGVMAIKPCCFSEGLFRAAFSRWAWRTRVGNCTHCHLHFDHWQLSISSPDLNCILWISGSFVDSYTDFNMPSRNLKLATSEPESVIFTIWHLLLLLFPQMQLVALLTHVTQPELQASPALSPSLSTATELIT